MATTSVRISIPTNAADRLSLGASIYEKHLADGDASPLKAIISHSWDKAGPEVANGLDQHKQAEDLKSKSELAYRKRDLSLSQVDESIKATRDLLLGIYRENPKELTQWGFSVSDSPRAAKKTNETTK
jgi:hypothetical protein